MSVTKSQTSGGSGGSGTVTSLTATLPATITPDPTTTTGNIGVSISVGSGLVGDGSPGSPLDVSGTPASEHGPDKFRAIGDGSLNIIDTVINPDTGLNWTQAEAEAYWYGCVTKYQVDEFVITNAVNGFTYTIDIGGTPYSYVAGGGDTVDDIADALGNLIDPSGDGSPQQNVTVVADTLRLVLTTSQTISISASNMTTSSIESKAINIDVAKDTVDWAAFQHALTLMEIDELNYLTCGNGKTYVITKSLELPHWIANGFMAVIDGKGCFINSGTNDPINILSRICPTSNEAVWMGFTNFHIRDFYLNGTAQRKQVGLYIEAAHNSLVEMVTVNSCEIGFDSRFCLKMNMINCHSVNSIETGFRGWNAEYFGADQANAGNNVARWVNCSATTPTGSTYGFHIRGSDSCKVDTCTIEAQPPLYGCYYDNNGSTVCKNFEITNTHIEFVGACGRAMIGARAGSPSDSNVLVSNMFVQGPGIFMEADADVSLLVILRDIPYVPDQPFLRSINGGYASWHIENSFQADFVTGGNFIDPDFWQVDGTVEPAYWATDFGGTVPFTGQLRHMPRPGTAGAVARFEDIADGLGYLTFVTTGGGLTGSGTPSSPLVASGGGGGTVTSIATAGLLSGGTITTSGTITTAIATNRLVGRNTAGTGVFEAITLGTNLSFTGTTLNAASTVPAGSTTEVQFKNGTAFGGSSNFLWDNTNSQLRLLANGTTSAPTLALGAGTNTGYYLLTTTQIGLALNGVTYFTWDTTGFAINTNRAAYLPTASGSATNPSFSFVADTTTGIYSNAASTIKWTVAGTQRGTIDSSGRMFIGAATAPAAFVHVAAGTTTIPPIQLTSGTSKTTAVAGSIEFTTDDIFFTITTGAARKRFLLADPVGGLTSGRVPFATTNGRITDDTSFTYSTSVGLALTTDLKLNTAGNGIYVKEGTNATSGIATLVGGTVTVNTTKVTANSRIYLTHQNVSGTLGVAHISARTAGTSFVISSSNVLDTSNIAWLIVEPA